MILRQRRLPGSGRSPENQRAGIVALNLRPQRLSRPNKVFLSDKLIERLWTHAIRKRPGAVAGVVIARNVLEKAHTDYFTTESQRHREK